MRRTLSIISKYSALFLLSIVCLVFTLSGCGERRIGTRGVTNYDQLDCSSPYLVSSSKIIKFMVFPLDSVGYDNVHAVFTLERGITVLRADLYLGGAIGTNDCSVLFNSSGDSCAIACTSGADGEGYNTTTDMGFDAAQVCTVQTIDGSAGTGGIDSYLVIQYTDL